MTTVHSSAPMRISISGGGSDLPELYRLGPTVVVAAALTHRVHVCVADRPDRATAALHEQGTDWSYLLPPDGSAHHPYHAAAAATIGLSRLPYIAVGSPVPPGSGLGGSGAYCNGAVVACTHGKSRFSRSGSSARFSVAPSASRTPGRLPWAACSACVLQQTDQPARPPVPECPPH
jgi:D-glycero-alpha-D-manno-heptose-7-phosphate kinase